ncbi:hypothetical protein, partial [Tritonibacter mobilis]|uniref:hypothetical protein n=1 Tax=Tritonibacter mobilis TaxID=379347 RepID=UPI00195505DB
GRNGQGTRRGTNIELTEIFLLMWRQQKERTLLPLILMLILMKFPFENAFQRERLAVIARVV